MFDETTLAVIRKVRNVQRKATIQTTHYHLVVGIAKCQRSKLVGLRILGVHLPEKTINEWRKDTSGGAPYHMELPFAR
jgi:hypothetical protein